MSNDLEQDFVAYVVLLEMARHLDENTPCPQQAPKSATEPNQTRRIPIPNSQRQTHSFSICACHLEPRFVVSSCRGHANLSMPFILLAWYTSRFVHLSCNMRLGTLLDLCTSAATCDMRNTPPRQRWEKLHADAAKKSAQRSMTKLALAGHLLIATLGMQSNKTVDLPGAPVTRI